MYTLSTNSKLHREGVDPRLIEISDLAITLSVIDFGHDKHGGLRTDEEQYELYLKQKSKCDGYRRRGNHQAASDGYGKALDFYAYVGGTSYEHHHLAMVACAFLQAASILGHRIKWGGLWKSDKCKIINGVAYGWDMPHIELID